MTVLKMRGRIAGICAIAGLLLAANTAISDAKTIVIQRTTVYIGGLPGGCVKKVYSGGVVVWKCGRYYYQPYRGRYVRVVIN